MYEVLTVVPVSIAKDLCDRKRIMDYNTMPNVNPAILDAVREFMNENVGYENLPIACLQISKKQSDDNSNVLHYIPANSKDNVLFQLEMPEDMVVSVNYQDLLDASSEIETLGGDIDSIECAKEDFKELLIIGGNPSDPETISFIPFLEYSKCKLYARFDENFQPKEMELPGIDRMPLAKLAAFVD